LPEATQVRDRIQIRFTMHTNTNSTDRSKLAPPALTGTVPRRQLLSQFAAVPTPCKWLCAPSGSGKSTLIAGYARKSDRHVVWYRLDARDDDPGFFFATFAAALSSCLRGAGTLPAFHDADTGREKAFAGRFFAAMLVRVRVPALWVFDDVQRIGADWLFEALAQLVQRNAPDLEVVFVSETPPPPAFFDAIVARQLSLANDFDLRFSADECSAIAQLARLAATRGEEVYALTGGHAGAVILACEFLRAARPSAATAATVNRQLHSHLLGKLAENLPEELRDLLLRTSSLPSLTVPIVDQLLGRSGSGELLEALADRGLLVRYPSDDGMTYEAHGLVRAAAKSLAASLFGAAEAQKQGERCARLLEANDRPGDAFALWLELGAEDQALDALDRLAPRLAGKRQAQILLKAIDRLPADRVGSHPWILFWAGESMLGIDERKSCDWFERAHQAFDDRSRSDGRLLSSAAALTALNSDPFDLGVINRWVGRLAADRHDAPELD
jgi:LuxR family maltose regulon positive regulatory protein